MFAKRQSSLATTAGMAPSSRLPKVDLKPVLELLKRPPVALGAAGALMVGAAALFIAVLGDPRAGAPSARVALNREAPAPAAAPTGVDAFTLDTLGF